jgi:Ubiquitin-2 like Rad60 SUMO-like
MSGSGPRRPLFNRPAWAAKDTSTEPKDGQIFGRHCVFDEVLALEEKKRIKREAEAKAQAKLKEEAHSKETEEPQSKKRRISKEIADEDSASDSGSTKTSRSTRSSTSDKAKELEIDRVTRSTPKLNKNLHSGLEDSPSKTKDPIRSKPDSVAIELEDDDSEINVSKSTSAAQSESPAKLKSAVKVCASTATTKPPDPPELESEDSEEDEYMRALKRKAREKSRLQRLGIGQSKPLASASPASDTRSPSIDAGRQDSPPTQPSFTDSTSDPFADTTTNTEDDPNVSILITSLIPNSKPLIVNRRASQPLQQVKDFWCARQNFEPAFATKVFFTWRGTKLFNSSTMRTVLRQLKKERGFDPDGSDDPSKGRITVEALTQEIYDERQKAKERKMAGESNDDNHSESEDVKEAPEPPPEPPKKDGVVIKLISQGLEPMPLRVRPNTSINKIMRAFQHQRGVDEEKTCWLVFDGDRLEKEASVEDVGFEDGDTIEVHPR